MAPNNDVLNVVLTFNVSEKFLSKKGFFMNNFQSNHPILIKFGQIIWLWRLHIAAKNQPDWKRNIGKIAKSIKICSDKGMSDLGFFNLPTVGIKLFRYQWCRIYFHFLKYYFGLRNMCENRRFN